MPISRQRQLKLEALRSVLSQSGTATELEACPSPLSGFRNKAKMAVAGRAGRLTLGLYGVLQPPLDLCDCPLYPLEMQAALRRIRNLLEALGIPPYNIDARSGELKFVLLTRATPDPALQLRLVLRSSAWAERIAAAVPAWQQALPELQVVSINLQPLPAALLEGEQETLLTEQRWLEIPLNRHRLCFGVRSFLQTNPVVAAALYAQAADWINELEPARVWDLYCGVGGFAFHAAAVSRRVDAIELSAEAIEAANASLNKASGDPALAELHFRCADATGVLPGLSAGELVIVNPPRRGLGTALCTQLNDSECRWLLYSSCALASLTRDLTRLSDFGVRRWRLFDMFPHSAHFETLVLLQRR